VNGRPWVRHPRLHAAQSRRATKRAVEPDGVIEVVDALERDGIAVWLDGGWGVDALVGEQTRPHADLDLAVDRDELEDIQDNLKRLGFRVDRSAEPGLPARMVMKDDHGREIDLHLLVFDGTGNGWQQLDGSGRAWGRYPAEDLTARGIVEGHAVNCLSAALQFRFRLGYEPTARDRHDLQLLQERFHVGPSLPDLVRPDSDTPS
jgi:lincosamide nucleotidyltransferase A/C/D/E